MSILRPCGSTLAALLADATVELMDADLVTITLQDGTTVYRFTSWTVDLTDGTHVWLALNPPIRRTGFSLTNTMATSKLSLEVLAPNVAFSGGSNFKYQAINGLLDGASVLVETLFMQPSARDFTLGTIAIFAGLSADVQAGDIKVKIDCKGKNDLLDQFFPRNVYQLPCNHAFCDPGCTLLRASFTFAFTAGGTPTRTFIPWSSPPSTPGRFQGGSFHGTSGAASGDWRTIVASDSSGITLAMPTSGLVLAGDTFTAFQGCDKTVNTCKNTYSNLQHFRAFPFVPPPDTAY